MSKRTKTDVVHRVSTRKRDPRSRSRSQRNRTMHVTGVGNVDESEIRRELNDMVDRFEDEVAPFGQRSHLNSIVLDLGGLELPLTEGELTRGERRYIQAAEQGDTSTIKRCLAYAKELQINPNCHDALGRDVLRIAIETEHLEMLDILLTYPQIELKDNLLHAISQENLASVEMLLQAQSDRGQRKNLKGLLGRVQTSAFTPDITPIMLAAHCDNYAIIKLLLDRGDRIAKPHDLRCSCNNCVQAAKADSLQHSKHRINAFRALSSPSLICLSSKDPILTAFELSWQLKRLGRLEHEFRTDYDQLSSNCQDFATAMLAQTRSSAELNIVLNHEVGCGNIGQHVNHAKRMVSDNPAAGAMKLSRLKLAIKYKQKRFVSHAHCQQLLASLWYDGLPGFRRQPMLQQVITMFTICCMFPVYSMAYIMLPNSKYGIMMKKPFVKFLCHSSSYLTFLGLLTLAALRIEFLLLRNIDERMLDRGPPPSYTEMCIILYVLGFLLQDIKKIYTWGLRAHLSNRWNLLDFVTNALYLATIATRSAAWLRVNLYNEPAQLDRALWNPYDPILISECLFAAANIFSTLKLVYVFTVSPQLGPLQISLARMMNDIFKFFCVYSLVLVAFAFGLNQLYWYYANKRSTHCKNVEFHLEEGAKDIYEYCTTRGQYLTNLFEISQTLYWSAYGLIDLQNLNLEYPHVFTEFVGKLTFGVYSGIAFIVLLNMLVAMMNDSYQRIAEQADVEWKFARSKLWISYFAEGNTVPVPFNLSPTPKMFFQLMEAVRQSFVNCTSKTTISQWNTIKRQIKKINEREMRYEAIMREMVNRYLMCRQKDEENQGVTEDDLNEIKGDISSFRHELLDIFTANGMSIPDHVKKLTGGKRLRRKASRRGRLGTKNQADEEFDNLMKSPGKEPVKKSPMRKADSPQPSEGRAAEPIEPQLQQAPSPAKSTDVGVVNKAYRDSIDSVVDMVRRDHTSVPSDEASLRAETPIDQSPEQGEAATPPVSKEPPPVSKKPKVLKKVPTDKEMLIQEESSSPSSDPKAPPPVAKKPQPRKPPPPTPPPPPPPPVAKKPTVKPMPPPASSYAAQQSKESGWSATSSPSSSRRVSRKEDYEMDQRSDCI